MTSAPKESNGRKPNRAPGSVWALRKDFLDYVRTLADDQIMLYVDGRTIMCDRRTARLLAKRINQCLDGTKGK